MKLWLFLCALLLLAGCDRPPPPQDTLRVGVPNLPPSYGDPYRAEGPPSSAVWQAIFDGLAYLTPEGKVAGALAESWSTTDGKLWRFDLRKNVRFSNGEPMTAEAVAQTFRWLMTKEGKATIAASRVRDVIGVRTEGAHTLYLQLKSVDAVFYKRLPSVVIVEPKSWRALGAEKFAMAPVGTGPYRLSRWDEKSRRAFLEANPYAWRKPIIPKLEIIELTEDSVRQQALISRDVDIARIGIDDLDLLEARGIRLNRSPSMQVMSVAFNTEGLDSPIDDVRVRQALNYAVNKEAMARELLFGFVEPIGQPGARTTVGFNPDVPAYPYDPAKAKQLLAQAGYPNGFDLKIEVIINSLPADSMIYQAMARDLTKVGVVTELRAVTFAEFLRKYVPNNFTVPAFGLSWQSAPFNDIQRPLEAFSCMKRPKAFFCDKALTKLVKQASAELDPQKRQDLLMELAKRYHEAAPALYLIDQIDVVGIGPRVEGVRVSNRVPMYEEIRFAR
jgi:peptide/nickel transport system substrate-binding protein